MKILSEHYKETFGCKVYKLSLDGGFSCPNRDGTLGTGGCIFCTGSGEFAEGGTDPIGVQLERAKERVRSKNKDGKYMAYFQAFTNTYAPVERLRKLYLEAIAPEDIVGLSIGTRPDCLGQEVVSLLAEINSIKPVSVELGLQTIHEETAKYIRRGYELPCFEEAVAGLNCHNIPWIVHIILGLPGETKEAVVFGLDLRQNSDKSPLLFHS
jgi:radical SAM protein (TIGR01212 family)